MLWWIIGWVVSVVLAYYMGKDQSRFEREREWYRR